MNTSTAIATATMTPESSFQPAYRPVDRMTCPDLPGPVEGVCNPAEWLQGQADWYRSFGTPWADWLSVQIDMMASNVEFTGINAPADMDAELNQMARIEVALEQMEAIVKRARK